MEGQEKLKSQTFGKIIKLSWEEVADAVSDKHLMTVIYKERP